MIFSRIQIGLVVVFVGALGAGLSWQVAENSRLAEVVHQHGGVAAIAALEKQIAVQTERATQAESRVAELLAAAKQTTVAARIARNAAPEVVKSDDVVKAVQARGRELSKDGKDQEALDEYIKCYREMRAIRPGSSACQRMMSEMKGLGRRFPPALKALAMLRDEAMQELARPSPRREVVFEIALLNRHAGEGERTVALHDTLPIDDSQRNTLAMIAFDAFVEARRYADALRGKPFGQMLGAIEAISRELPKREPSMQAMMREGIVKDTLTHIEVLAGAGKADDARLLTEKLLAFDNTPATRTRLEQHLARAGRAE